MNQSGDSRAEVINRVLPDKENNDGFPMNTNFDEVCKKLKKEGIKGMALIGKTGDLIQEDLPHQVQEENFSTMCATIVAASCEVDFSLSNGKVDSAIVHLDAADLLLTTIDSTILAVVMEKNTDTQEIKGSIDELVRRVW